MDNYIIFCPKNARENIQPKKLFARRKPVWLRAHARSSCFGYLDVFVSWITLHFYSLFVFWRAHLRSRICSKILHFCNNPKVVCITKQFLHSISSSIWSKPMQHCTETSLDNDWTRTRNAVHAILVDNYIIFCPKNARENIQPKKLFARRKLVCLCARMLFLFRLFLNVFVFNHSTFLFVVCILTSPPTVADLL